MKGSSTVPPPLGLRLIATFKFVKAAVLLAAGVGAFNLSSPERMEWAQDWLEGLSLDQGHRLAASLAGQALGLLNLSEPDRFSKLAVGALLFAALFVVEGVGLALARRWAEFLTVGVTMSYLPVEVVSSWHRWTLLRAGTIVLNVAVVVYLLVQLRATSNRGGRGAYGSGAGTGRWRR